MKIKALAIAAAIAATGIIPAAATAGQIKECGNFELTGNHNHGYWTYRLVYRYTPVFNLTTRNVSCSITRPFSLRATSRMTFGK